MNFDFEPINLINDFNENTTSDSLLDALSTKDANVVIHIIENSHIEIRTLYDIMKVEPYLLHILLLTERLQFIAKNLFKKIKKHFDQIDFTSLLETCIEKNCPPGLIEFLIQKFETRFQVPIFNNGDLYKRTTPDDISESLHLAVDKKNREVIDLLVNTYNVNLNFNNG